MTPNSFVSTSFACLTLLGGLTAQRETVEWMGPQPSSVYPTRIEVKLVEGCGAVLRDGKLSSRAGKDLSSVAALFAAGSVEPLFQLPLATLDRWYAATRGGPEPRPDHLGLWFRVTGKDAAQTDALQKALRANEWVQDIYREPVPSLPGGSDLAPPTPQYRWRQDYAKAPPNGVHADVAHRIIGGRGRGIKITDMEVYWTGEHEDLLAMDAPDVFLGRRFVGSNGAHGTAVVGEMAGDRNGYGVRGLSDMAKIHVSSWNDGGVSSAIARGVNVAGPGDIVLLEVHYNTSQGYVPAECFNSNYNVILTATRMGVNICEAAGNGSVNLNTLAINGLPAGFLDPSSTNFRDSGAIMIGATSGSATAAAGFSNHGRRITANGWGRNVVTTGYGSLFSGGSDIRQYYTATFSGTSSASPIVTACVADLVGAVKYQDERVLTVNEVRNLLRSHGTPCSGNIQNRPDMAAMLRAVGLPDGLSQSRETHQPGQDFETELTGPTGGAMALFVSDSLVKTDLGMNRKFHLDLSAMIHLGTFSLPTQLKFTIPNLPSLKGQEFFTQGIQADTNSNLRVTSSNQAYIQ